MKILMSVGPLRLSKIKYLSQVMLRGKASCAFDVENSMAGFSRPSLQGVLRPDLELAPA